ncbi:MAG: hypothetical protein DRQ78_12115 [Epsilonproteobacteria bacterium]|nr:MAG: hypothetical protein DRQ78_12115 [Campylobacterota bacterium]
MKEKRELEMLIATYSAIHAIEDDGIKTIGIDKENLVKVREYLKDAVLGGIGSIYNTEEELNELMDLTTRIIVSAAKELGCIPKDAHVKTGAIDKRNSIF